VLECSESPDALELKDLFGQIVPHELAHEVGRVIIDPSETEGALVFFAQVRDLTA